MRLDTLSTISREIVVDARPRTFAAVITCGSTLYEFITLSTIFRETLYQPFPEKSSSKHVLAPFLADEDTQHVPYLGHVLLEAVADADHLPLQPGLRRARGPVGFVSSFVCVHS